MSNEFENAIKVLREKANMAAYAGQASMRVPLSMLLGILGRAEEWPDLTRLRAENKALRADAALGRAVRKEIALLENSREQGNILSDTEDDWLNSLQGFVAGLMEVEK